jgi:aspartyl-tRNA(Asn)/glutamyl-tRNA(Gln) amidotransferase subunit B
MRERALEIEALATKTPPQRLVELLGLVENRTINNNTAKEVLAEMVDSGYGAREIVDARGLVQVSDEAALVVVVTQVLDEHPDEVTQYLGGKEAVSGWLMGQVMRATRGKANPQLARRILMDQLECRALRQAQDDPSTGSG